MWMDHLPRSRVRSLYLPSLQPPPSSSSVSPGVSLRQSPWVPCLPPICTFKIYLQTHLATKVQPPSLPLCRVSGSWATCVHKSPEKHIHLLLRVSIFWDALPLFGGVRFSLISPSLPAPVGRAHSLAAGWCFQIDPRQFYYYWRYLFHGRTAVIVCWKFFFFIKLKYSSLCLPPHLFLLCLLEHFRTQTPQTSLKHLKSPTIFPIIFSPG